MSGLLWLLIGVCGYFLWVDEVYPRLALWWAKWRALRLFKRFRREGAISEAEWAEFDAAIRSAGREDEG